MSQAVGIVAPWPWAGVADQHDKRGVRGGETGKAGVGRDKWEAECSRPFLGVTLKILDLTPGKLLEVFDTGSDVHLLFPFYG